MKKLLQLNATANWGSTGRIAEGIGLSAMERGWESYIAYGRYCNESASEMIKIGSKGSVYLHYLSQRFFDNEGLCSQKPTRRLIEQIREINPDIIHLHNIHDHYLNYKLLFEYLNLTDIKIVWTMHDFWAMTGHCMHFVTAQCTKYASECSNCPIRTGAQRFLFDRSRQNFRLKKRLFTANPNLHVVAVSEWVGKIIGESFLKEKPITVINNGIDLSIFRPTYSDYYDVLLNGKFVILAVASQWKSGKGLSDYKTMSKMLSEDEVIVLVGVDDEIISHLPQNIIGVKRTDSMQKLSELYTRANVVTVLSSAETFGLTIVEGYACGTPAVVYDNTAPPSLITPDTGFVVENHNPAAAYQAIQEIKKRGKGYYKDYCISLARERYDKHDCVSHYLNLYESLLTEKSKNTVKIST